MRLIAATVMVVLAAGCTTPGGPGPAAPAPVVAHHHLTVVAVAERFATLDGSQRDAGYLKELRRLHRGCPASSPSSLGRIVTNGDAALKSHRIGGASYRSVLRSLTADRTSRRSRPHCAVLLRRFTAEVDGAAARRGATYDGYAATTNAFAAGHRADRAHPGGYLPRLPDGQDAVEIGGDPRVTRLTLDFDPPLSEPLAVGVVRRDLLPGRLHSVYRLQARQCAEVIYLSPRLGRLLSNPALGVMIELTSGRGVSSRYDPALVDRAVLTPGGRIGGQPCV